MPERRRATRAVAAVSGGLLALALAGPVALAQTEPVPPSDDLGPGQQPPPAPGQPSPEPPSPEPPPPPDQPEPPEPGTWQGSRISEPAAGAELRRTTFDVRGTVQYGKQNPTDRIDEIQVRIVDDPDDDFEPASGCSLPPAARPEITGGRDDVASVRDFLLADVSVSCNGRYLVEVQAELEGPTPQTHTFSSSFVVAAMPASVTGLGVTLDGEDRAVTATFQPLSGDALAPDATGYVLERSGPGGGAFVDVATIGLDDEPHFVDPLTDAPAGAYTYRVRAVRAGADGDVRSSTIDTETDTVEVEGDPSSSSTSSPKARSGRTTGAAARPGGGRSTLPRPGRAPGLSPSTTLDTGFDDTLDYGEGGELAGDDPLAGSSIVRDEQAGMGLAVPAAGALVMLGWAGHILYLNRLAKQL